MEILQRSAAASEDGPTFTYDIIPDTQSEDFKRHFTSPVYAEGLAKMMYDDKPCVLTPEFAHKGAEKILYDFQVRPDDVWVVTFPKSGTTWALEMVWSLLNITDFQGEKSKVSQALRSPFLEMTLFSDVDKLPEALRAGIVKEAPDIHSINRMESPRVLKSHIPFGGLPANLLDTCKVVYVARNPKDVIVSYYFHHRLFQGMAFSGTVEEFAEFFIKDQVWYAPFFPHVLDAWSRREHPNLMFLYYEDMKRDLKGTVQRVARFLNRPVDDEALLQSVVNHLTFECMSKNASVSFDHGIRGHTSSDGRFMRKGKVGDWRNHFSEEFNKKLDEWISGNLANSDLTFEFSQ